MKNKLTILLLLFIGFSLPSAAQEVDSVFEKVEVMPSFPGGEKAMFKFVGKNLSYPRIARETGITGVVYASFIINTDGSLSDKKIVKDIGGGCGDEVLKVINEMPKWLPGSQDGKKVRVHYTLPVSFETDDSPKKKEKKRKNK